MKSSAMVLAGMMFSMLFLAGSGRADPITWSYSWSGGPDPVVADGAHSGGIFLLDPQPGTLSGSQNVVATQVEVFTAAHANAPDVFPNEPYHMDLTLHDGSATGNLTFTGLFNGVLSVSGVQLSNTFTGQTTQLLTLNGHFYTVTVGGYTPPPNVNNPGTIHAQIDVRDIEHPPPQATPEPSGIVLAGLGLSCLGLVVRRVRRPCNREASVPA
jgi:hypothetical protein